METQNLKTSSVAARSSVPIIDWTMDQYYFYDEVKNEAPKFLGLSLTVHIVVLLAVTFITIPLLQKPEVETITIEIADSAPGIRAPKISRIQPPVFEPVEEKVPEKQEEATIVKTIPVLKHKSTTGSSNRREIKPAAKEVSKVAKYTSVKPLASTLDDIQAQDLAADSKLSSVSNINPQLLDQEMDNDIRVINQRHKKSLAQEKKKLLSQLAAEESAADQELSALEKSNAIRREQLAQANAERRAKDQAALAALRAKENADAQAAAEQAAANAAAEAAAKNEAAARESAARQAALDQAAKNRQKSLAAAAAQDGYGGKSKINKNGLPAGVRDLSEMRQMPGNPRPQYESNERLQGQQGQVSFLAYVTKDGAISKLKPLKQTGYSNLDQKSLEAVKKWKFYPGQEGWVEIPFSWDLKGGPQEMPTLLRRSVSRR